MNASPRFALGPGSEPAPRARDGSGVGPWLSGLFGFLATGLALAVGAVLAVFAAAAVAVIALFASVLVFLGGLAFRASRKAYARPNTTTVIEARKVGHAWVAYGWDRSGR